MKQHAANLTLPRRAASILALANYRTAGSELGNYMLVEMDDIVNNERAGLKLKGKTIILLAGEMAFVIFGSNLAFVCWLVLRLNTYSTSQVGCMYLPAVSARPCSLFAS